jgi:DNA-binding NarL/FixJ family response regulator
MAAHRARVALADDEVLLREGLANLLARAGFDVVSQAGDAQQLLSDVQEHHPDLVICDIRMPPGHMTEGLDAAHAIRAQLPDIAIMVLSAHAEAEHAADLLAGGDQIGYLLKDRVTDVDEFLDAINRILRGGTVVDPVLVKELIGARQTGDPLDGLSSREREVLELMAEGRSNAAIGKNLWITEGTVEKHVRSIFMKLHIPESSDAHRRVLAVLTFLHRR